MVFRRSAAARSTPARLPAIETVKRLLAANLSVNGSPQVGLSDYSASLSAKYSFDESTLLRGFGIGTNISYRGPVLLGYQIEADGTAMLGNKAYADGPTSIDLNVSYGRRLLNRYRWDVWLQVNNVFNERGAIPTQATWDYGIRQFFITSNTMRETRMVSVTTRLSF